MGMAASQVRFLSLQDRNSNITRQLSTLSNRKMALARDMNTVSRNYTNALSQTTLKWSSDSGNTYNTLTYDLLMTPNDLNTSTPYILTEASTGRVVLNDDALYDSDGNVITLEDGSALTYTYLASLISSYSGVDATTGELTFNNTSYLSTASDGTVSGLAAESGSYYIPDSDDFDFDNNLRYYLFTLLGLVSEEDYAAQQSLLVQLYGSPEAKETGVYPLGCAWGDYYYALANLEAYEAFTSTDQYAAAANSIKGKSQSTEIDDYVNSTDPDHWDGYVYTADLDASTGTSSDSVITQDTSYNESAVSHIDFSSVVTTDSDGSYYVSTSSSTVSSVLNTYDISSSSDWTYDIDVSSSGITYTYSADDVWQNAVNNISSTDSSYLDEYVVSNNWDQLTVQDIIDKLQSSTASEQLVAVAESGDSSLDLDDVPSILEEYIDAFISILGYNSILTLDDDLLEQAKTETAQYFVDNAYGGFDGYSGLHSGSTKAKKKAKQRANGYNRVGFSKYGGVHSHSWAYVDLGTLFSTFVTNYTNLYTGGSVATLSSVSSLDLGFGSSTNISYKGTTTDTFTETDPDTFEETTYSYIRETQYDSSSGSYRVEIYDGESGEVVTDEDDNSVTTEYDQLYEVIYNTSGTYCDLDADGVEETLVYGTVETADGDIYYATAIEQINNFLDATNSETYLNAVASGLTLYSETVSLEDADTDFYIAASETKSTYACYFAGIPIADEEYYAYLQQQVTDAQEYIAELEDDLENFYSSADQKIMDYYDALFQRIAENGWTTDNATSTSSNSNANEYLNNKLQNYDYMITVCTERADETGYYYTTKLAESILTIFEVDDDSVQAEALAEYEYEKALIENKESKIDTIMEKLETEQSAITTEMDSLQNVISDNIDRTFKIFA